jgi:hypothetical protein
MTDPKAFVVAVRAVAACMHCSAEAVAVQLVTTRQLLRLTTVTLQKL